MKLKNLLPVVAVALCFALLTCLLLRSAKSISLKTSAPPANQKPVIVIDAGHGGEDGGAVVGEVLEKEINLAVSRDLADYLTLCGFEVKMTRQTDDSLSNEGADIRARKVNDMKRRLEIYNSSPRNIIIGIHQNKFSDASSHGAQIFYSPNTEGSASLAESIRGAIISSLQPDNSRECKAAGKEIYLLKNAEYPAVLVECGFLSNRGEREKLLSEEYRRQLAAAIATGLLNYYQI